MKFLQDTFLGQLRKGNKTILFFIYAVLAVTILTSAAGLQLTPFLVYGMYSTPEPARDTFVIYSLEYDGKKYNAPEIWNYHKKAMFDFTIDHYFMLKEHDNKDPYEEKTRNILKKAGIQSDALLGKLYNSEGDITRYPSWLKTYMKANLGTDADTMNVFRIVTKYDNTGHVNICNKELILPL